MSSKALWTAFAHLLSGTQVLRHPNLAAALFSALMSPGFSGGRLKVKRTSLDLSLLSPLVWAPGVVTILWFQLLEGATPSLSLSSKAGASFRCCVTVFRLSVHLALHLQGGSVCETTICIPCAQVSSSGCPLHSGMQETSHTRSCS